jgi:histidinol dehydrogenase
MQIIKNPKKYTWASLLERPSLDNRFLERTVASIISDVREHGDSALRHCAKQFDKLDIEELQVTEEEFQEADLAVSVELKSAILLAKRNIEIFHSSQVEEMRVVETMPGVMCWRKSVAIDRVGLYVPAGSAPLFSTVLMLAIPAAIAGCREVVICSAPDSEGRINPATLYAASVCGVKKVFKTSGAQAIAAMAFGTQTVPKVDKIFGPGNQYVTEAKMQVSKLGTAIDMPAGPSEVAIYADETCVPGFVAADLLSQAEHGPDSQVLLVATNEEVANAVIREIYSQIESLPRKEIAAKSLENSKAIVFEEVESAIELLNEYAAEHLILATENPDPISEKITNAGSVFLGNLSCESAGDYASGTNHTLPTNGWARSYSGVSLDSFVKKITYQQISEEGMRNIGPAIETMASAEELEAHRRAVTIRLEAIGR